MNIEYKKKIIYDLCKDSNDIFERYTTKQLDEDRAIEEIKALVILQVSMLMTQE